jgi:ribose transport system substrate-binding protein
VRKTTAKPRYPVLGAALALASIALAACSSAATSGSSPASSTGNGAKSSSGTITIGFAQAFSTNAWQTANNTAVNQAVAALNAQGKKVQLKFLDANSNVATQITDIDSLILDKVNVILLDPTSATALNGAIAKAVAAGIPVVNFADGLVTSSLPTELQTNLIGMQVQAADYIAQRLGGKGNVLNVRGLAGAPGDVTLESGTVQGFQKYPGIKLVGPVYGAWDEATSESATAQLLPTLPHINAVITQGGEGYGVAQAMLAAKLTLPIIVMGGIGEEFKLWAAQNKLNGYDTISLSVDPAIGAAAVYVGYELASGGKVPKSITFPALEVTSANLNQFTNLPATGVAESHIDLSWVESHLLNQ